MRYTFSLILFVMCLACGGSKTGRLTVSKLSQLTGQEVATILFDKQYNVNHTPQLEHSLLFVSKGQIHVAFVSQDKNLLLGKVYPLASQPKLNYLKSQFINTGNGYSHVLHLFEQEEILQLVLAAPNFFQTIAVNKLDIKKLFISKVKENEPDEILSLGESVYRFNGLEYTSYNPELPFFYYEGWQQGEDGSYFNLSNRGAFTRRAIITLSFPQAQDDNLQLRRQFAHVKQYRISSTVHYRGGKTIRTTDPMIEITREPFASAARMSLPLSLDPKVEQMRLRIAYVLGSTIYYWPEKGSLDQQGYPALLLPIKEKLNE